MLAQHRYGIHKGAHQRSIAAPCVYQLHGMRQRPCGAVAAWVSTLSHCSQYTLQHNRLPQRS